MKTKLTRSEKVVIANAVKAHEGQLRQCRYVLSDDAKKELDAHTGEIHAIWVKWILSFNKITVQENWSLQRFTCPICGIFERGETPENGSIADMRICERCFKQYEPKLYKEVDKRNEEYWKKAYPKTGETSRVYSGEDMPF